MDETSTSGCSYTTALESVQSNAEDEFVEGSHYFKVNDYVDVKDIAFPGSWSLAKVIEIKKNPIDDNSEYDPYSPVKNDGLIYVVEFYLFYGPIENKTIKEVYLQEIRPYASEILPFDELKIGDKVLMNYNCKFPHERGIWYDVTVKSKNTSESGCSTVIGDIHIKADTVLKDINLLFVDNIHRIKPYKLLVDRTPEDDTIMQTKPAVIRSNLHCVYCKDVYERKPCKICWCKVCGEKNELRRIFCSKCYNYYHVTCLNPPYIDNDNWIPNQVSIVTCSFCKINKNQIVEAEELNNSEAEILESISTSECDRDMDMVCVRQKKSCNPILSKCFGPIPGIEVGTSWLTREKLSEAGIHCCLIGGIHCGKQGAYSIILNSGYEVIDNGDIVLYTGFGGWTRANKALAINCNAELNYEKGAKSDDWTQGKPVRVIRNFNLYKYSDYAPKIGYRYDGLYKVFEYFMEVKSPEFICCWSFLLRRDDPTPSPWTAHGKNRIIQLGLNIINPENSTPNVDATNEIELGIGSKREMGLEIDFVDNEENESDFAEDRCNICETGSETDCETDSEADCETDCENNDNSKRNLTKNDNNDYHSKKIKTQYTLDKESDQFIQADVVNKKYWDDCKKLLNGGKKAFLNKVTEIFSCICCQKIVYKPITTECSHNVCEICMKTSFNSEIFQCPSCGVELEETSSMEVNENLSTILLHLFPGYDANRK